MTDASAIDMIELDRLDLHLDSGPCAYSQRHRTAIDAHFARLLRERPELWNGRVLLMGEGAIAGRTLRGHCVETDYATLLWLLREDAVPDLRNCFAAAALRGSDGGFVLARQAPWTFNAGRVYFATGTPDPSDVTSDGRVDLEAGMWRELAEETGLRSADFASASGWVALRDARRIVLMRELVAPVSAEVLAARIRGFIAREDRPEVDEVVIARSEADLGPAMPDFIIRYLRAVWA
ncbi:NUDIX domain-containing protein [Ancylobacter mangrovi]|uniref:NUDIX domain-containing protein n=1 Tax=Ancylobacter mangrovi TaxID=2972472 RepID=UPI0021621E69|nr:NUDIX domain-containing protein [Ancylobacter mangrovi]MCS0501704.1 NUDIX hydrolase [Ancylobacter mangrovi]